MAEWPVSGGRSVACETTPFFGTTAGAVSAAFGTLSYCALHEYPPPPSSSEQHEVLFPSNLGTLLSDIMGFCSLKGGLRQWEKERSA